MRLGILCNINQISLRRRASLYLLYLKTSLTSALLCRVKKGDFSSSNVVVAILSESGFGDTDGCGRELLRKTFPRLSTGLSNIRQIDRFDVHHSGLVREYDPYNLRELLERIRFKRKPHREATLKFLHSATE